MEKLKRTLTFLLNESKSLTDRLNSLSPKNGEYYIKGLGKAIITPILLVVYPDKYGVWNQKRRCFKKLELFPEFQRKFFGKNMPSEQCLNNLKENMRLVFGSLMVLGEIAGIGRLK